MHPHSHLEPASAPANAPCSAERDRLDSPHDARLPLLSALLTIATIGSEPLGEARAFLLYLPAILGFGFQGERSIGPLLKRVAPLLPVLLLLALGFPLSRAMDGWLAGASGVSVFSDSDAWWAGLSLFLRALCAVLLLSSLVHAERFPRILEALRRLGLPAAVVLTLQQMERYRALIAEEWRRSWLAREARSPGPLRFAFSSYSNQTALVLLRSWERSERVHAAMLARGFRIDAPLPAGRGAAISAKGIARAFWLPLLATAVRLTV